jgi:Zn finger protein HypA/HybF involved in hydrogenase expression
MRIDSTFWYCDECDSEFSLCELDSYSCPKCSSQLIELERDEFELPKRSLSVGSENSLVTIP